MAVIKGKGAPTRNTPGLIGDTYIDTDAKKAYKCVFACKIAFNDPEYDWKPTDYIPVTVEEKPKKVVDKPIVEETTAKEKTEEVFEETKEESKPNYSNYSNYSGKPRNNYNKQYTNYKK